MEKTPVNSRLLYNIIMCILTFGLFPLLLDLPDNVKIMKMPVSHYYFFIFFHVHFANSVLSHYSFLQFPYVYFKNSVLSHYSLDSFLMCISKITYFPIILLTVF